MDAPKSLRFSLYSSMVLLAISPLQSRSIAQTGIAPPAAPAVNGPSSGLPGNVAPPASKPADPDALVRYVPAEKLTLLLEFQGFDQHSAAWNESATAKILSETNTGAMLEEIVTQVFDQATKGLPDRRTTSQEELALLKLMFRSGFVFSMSQDPKDPNAVGVVLVYRNAFQDENKTLFAKLISRLSVPGAPPTIMDKPGGRRVVVAPGANGMPMGWWVEDRRDLVICVPNTFADSVIQSLDGKSANASTNPVRARLAKASPGLEPLGWAMVDLATVQPLPAVVEPYGIKDVRSLQLRWSIEGKAIRTDLDLETPAPRTGVLGLMEQPGFKVAEIPKLPESFDSFAMASFIPARFLNEAKALAERLGQKDSSNQFDQMAAAFEKSTKLDLRKDLLEILGPHFTYYTQPQKKTGITAALNAFNPLAGLQIPRFTLLVDVTDEKAANKALTKLLAYANKQLATMTVPGLPPGAAGPDGLAEPPGSPPRPGGRSAPAGAGAQASSKGATGKKAQAVSIRMTSPKPLTFQLSLPEPLATMMGIKPTLILGPKHLILASGLDLATEALRLEEKKSESWVPSGEFGEAVANLPGSLVYVSATDPRDSVPKALAELPTTLNTVFSQLDLGIDPARLSGMTSGTAGAGSPVPPGGSPLTAGTGQPAVSIQGAGAGTRALVSPSEEQPPQAANRSANSPPGNSVPAGYPGSGGGGPRQGGSGPAPGAPGAGAQPNVPGQLKLVIDPSKIPTPESIRPFLFPGATALSFDDSGIHWVSRQAFFDVGSVSVLAGTVGAGWMKGSALPGLPPGMGAGPPGSGPNPPFSPPGGPGAGPGSLNAPQGAGASNPEPPAAPRGGPAGRAGSRVPIP